MVTSKKWRRLKFGVLLALNLVLAVSCSGALQNQPANPAVNSAAQVSQAPLKVSYSPWTGFFPMAIALKQGVFERHGVKVEGIFYHDQSATTAKLADLAAGKLDGALIALGEAVQVGNQSEIQVVAITDESSGADAIMSQPGITRVADLKGKRLGVGLGSFGELFATEMLKANGLTPDDVLLVKVNPERVSERLKSGDIHAGHTWEPYVSEMKDAHQLFTSKDTPGLIPDVIVFSAKAVSDRPEDIRAFLSAWFESADYLQTHLKESAPLIAQVFKMPAKSISLDGIKLLTQAENIQAFASKSSAPSSAPRSIQQTALLYSDFFVRSGSLNKPVDPAALVNATFLQPASGS